MANLLNKIEEKSSERVFREGAIEMLDNYHRMYGMLKRIHKGTGVVLPYNTATALRRLLEDLDK